MSPEDDLDIFDTGLSTIFDIRPIGFAPSNGFYTYHPPSTAPSGPPCKPIELRLPQPPSELYNTLQANLIWPSALYLADLLAKQVIEVKDKRVAELGAAAGLPGIVALRDGRAARVVSTDWGVEEVLSVLRSNFACACQNTSEGQGRWSVIGHQWGTDPAELLAAISGSEAQAAGQSAHSLSVPPGSSGNERKLSPSQDTFLDSIRFDTLLAADVLWVSTSHPALLDSIQALLAKGGTAHITAGLHTGRGPLERFVTAARERGMAVELVKEVRLGKGTKDDWEDYDESMRRNGEEERGVVVYLTVRHQQ
ncbi:hypothetical protein IAU60_004452 [Kwoniella sp. DSM 27419]